MGWEELKKQRGKKNPNNFPITTYVILVETVSFGSTPVLVRLATFGAS